MHLRGQERLVDLVLSDQWLYEQRVKLVELSNDPRGRSYFRKWESGLPPSLSGSCTASPTEFPGAPACSDNTSDCGNSKPRVNGVEEVQPPQFAAPLAETSWKFDVVVQARCAEWAPVPRSAHIFSERYGLFKRRGERWAHWRQGWPGWR